ALAPRTWSRPSVGSRCSPNIPTLASTPASTSSFSSSSTGASARLAVTDKSPVRARLDHLLTEVASAAPAPASGSAAAAVVATAAALLQKVALRSKSRWTGATDAHDRAQAIMVRAEELIELDTLAFPESG